MSEREEYIETVLASGGILTGMSLAVYVSITLIEGRSIINGAIIMPVGFIFSTGYFLLFAPRPDAPPSGSENDG